MLISARWLEELLMGSAESPLTGEQLDRELTRLGLEVEGVSRLGRGLDSIVVGELRSVEKHPHSDKLHLVTLFDGSNELQIVCGAQNLPGNGGKVAFAPLGTTLPNGLTLTLREVKGVASHGMICSESELEIGGDDDGILVLPSDWNAGERLIDRVPAIVDDIVEVSVTPNRPDALGHWGVAQDLAVSLGLSVRRPELRVISADVVSGERLVTLEDTAGCGRYIGVTIDGVQVGPSSLPVRVRLHRLGLRAINNVVDATNYVLMATGQPTHAFDLDRLAESRVVVRRALAGEKLRTLDGAEATCVADDLVIADAKAPQALAGVMGGESSMVTASTTRLLLETAWFEPRGVRASAKRHGFHTDSSHRFERTVDYGERLELAGQWLFDLVASSSGGRATSRADVRGQLPTPAKIEFRPSQVSRLLGFEIAPELSAKILRGLGILISDIGEDCWLALAPTGRPDLTREVDLIEEVMRHRGLEELPNQHVVPSPDLVAWPRPVVLRQQAALADLMRAKGMHEHISLAFADECPPEQVLRATGGERRVKLMNPLRVQASYLRHHLLPGLLDALKINLSRHSRSTRLFEQGRIYRWPVADELARMNRGVLHRQGDEPLPDEPLRLAVLWSHVEASSRPTVHDLVTTMLEALAALGMIAQIRSPSSADPVLHPGVQGAICVQREGKWHEVGVVGEVHPDLLDACGVEASDRPAYAELRMEDVASERVYRSHELPRFPASARDLSLEIERRTPAVEVLDALAGAAQDVVEAQGGAIRLAAGDSSAASVEVIEDYQGEKLAPGRRSLLVRLHYRASDRSPTDQEVQQLHDATVAAACERLRAAGRFVAIR